MQYNVNIGLNFVTCEPDNVELNRSSTTVHFQENRMALALALGMALALYG